jgi:HlyD family secretion protein
MSRVVKNAVLAIMFTTGFLVAGSKAREKVEIDVITIAELSMIENPNEGDCVTIKIERNDDGVIEAVVIEDGKAKKVKVQTGISDFDNIEIVGGISEGQEVITGPFLEVSKNLEDGTSVKANDPDKKEED